MLRTCSRAQRSQVHSRLPPSTQTDQLIGRVSADTAPQAEHVAGGR